MKRIIFIFLAAMMSTAVCSAAMSNSKVRKETRFLTDKMAYELNLSTEQYNDVYEINYDFISGIRYLMDDVLRGEEWALNRYYDYLDVRNDDLRWVLNNRQYGRFMQAAYFYRPVYVSGAGPLPECRSRRNGLSRSGSYDNRYFSGAGRKKSRRRYCLFPEPG